MDKCLLIFLCYFTCQAQKVTIYRNFNLILILGKLQDDGQDGDHCFVDVKSLQQRHHP